MCVDFFLWKEVQQWTDVYLVTNPFFTSVRFSYKENKVILYKWAPTYLSQKKPRGLSHVVIRNVRINSIKTKSMRLHLKVRLTKNSDVTRPTNKV